MPAQSTFDRKWTKFRDKYLVEESSGSDRWDVMSGWTLVYPDAGGLYPGRNLVLYFHEDQMYVLNPEMVEASDDVLLDHFKQYGRKNAEKGYRTFQYVINFRDDPSVLDNIYALEIPD